MIDFAVTSAAYSACLEGR